MLKSPELHKASSVPLADNDLIEQYKRSGNQDFVARLYEHYMEMVFAVCIKYLRDNEVKLVGIDAHNIDDTSRNSRPVHTILLGADILIVEHLCNLASLPDTGFTFSAIPPKFKGVGTFPVRALAKITR